MKFFIGSTAAFIVSLVFTIVFFSLSDFDGIKKDVMSGKYNFDKKFNLNIDVSDEPDWEEKALTFAPLDIEKISVSSVASRVLISGAERDDILVKVKADKEDLLNHFKTNLKDKALFITDGKEKEDKSLSSLFGKDGTEGIIIDISVPEKFKSSYMIEVAFGEINIHKVSGELFEIETAAGDIEVNDVEFKDFSIAAAAGSVNIESAVLGKGSVEAAAGDIDLKRIESKELFEIEAAAGDIDLQMSQESPRVKITAAAGDIDFSLTEGTPYNFTFKNSTTIGSLKLNPPHKKESESTAVFGSGKGFVEVETSFGDVEVN